MTGFLNVYTDGGARGNPGPSAIGVFITDENNNRIEGFGGTIGFSTNNKAEYKAVIAALDWIIDNNAILTKDGKINFFLDSNLVYSQISGIFKIKDPELRSLLFKIREREAQINHTILYRHIPREKNKEADRLVNEALDKHSRLS